MDELAQELVDHIIDCCHLADKDTMSSCGLVCKRWLPRSRCHLFSKVSLNPDSLRSFVDLIDSSSFPILSFIRHLTLEHDTDLFDTTHWALDWARLHPCPNLNRIEITFGAVLDRQAERWLSSHLCPQIRAWNDNSSSVSRLDLTSTSPVCSVSLSWRSIINIMACLPCIDTLRVYRIQLASLPVTAPSLVLSHLANLDLDLMDDTKGNLFFTWLLSLPVVPILQSLSLRGVLVTNGDWSDIAAYIQRGGGGLESLDLGLEGYWKVILEFQRQIYPNTTSLCHLTIDIWNPSQLLDLIPILPGSENLKSVTVSVCWAQLKDWDKFPWSALDTALAEPQFRTLKRFSIDVYEYSRENEVPLVPPQMKLLMPLANARGILE
ncbi:hypothetical protein FB451DRAFT_1558302 [Mycena latifolia]|nr:hypothetical protein FB451DRAFT_1558302 [Mycena latifolia]